jgi:predicted nucleotidyltransferase component of viral defense system
MSKKAMSLKGKINNYAKNKRISAQVVLQNYMFEKFLERLSLSEYRDKFVIKGGMLIAAIVGLDTRSTMDLDATLKNLPLTEPQLIEAITNICNIKLDDEVIFKFISISPIRKDDRYGGFCIRIDAGYDTIVTPLSIDVSTGDVITPTAVQYEFTGIFNSEKHITLWGYNIETVLAEKTETVLSRGELTTRPRDYYDIYILGSTQKYDIKLFKEALAATAEHRGSTANITDIKEIVEALEESAELKELWRKYQASFSYAKEIAFKDIMDVIKKLVL